MKEMIMKIKEEDKDLNYWKKNCEEDYLHTPISVLRYITKLESKVNSVALDDCVLEIIDYLGSRNGFDNWWLQVEDNEESEITKKLEDIIERRLNQNKDE